MPKFSDTIHGIPKFKASFRVLGDGSYSESKINKRHENYQKYYEEEYKKELENFNSIAENLS